MVDVGSLRLNKNCQFLSQMLLLCFPKGVAAPPLDSRSQGLCPLDPTPHPLRPLSNKWRGGTASRVPSSGVRSTGSGEVAPACPTRSGSPHGAPGMAADVRCHCFLGAALPCILLLLCWHSVGAAPSPASSGRGVAASAVGVRFAGRSSTTTMRSMAAQVRGNLSSGCQFWRVHESS